MVNLLIKESEAIGIEILTNQHVISIEKKLTAFWSVLNLNPKPDPKPRDSKLIW
jgi:hypothetical protein